jgi:hypothetical protein
VSAAELIAMSIAEDRTVTEYPPTRTEYDALLDDLLVSSVGDVDHAEHSGAGYSGLESRGWTMVWSTDGWQVDLIHPASAGGGAA